MKGNRNLRMLARYTAWANARLYQGLSALPGALLAEARPGRANGMIGVLGHICAVDLIWKAHLEGAKHGFTSRNFDALPAFEALHRLQEELDQWYLARADEEDEQSLEETVSFEFVDGGQGSMSRGDILLHVFNHKTYHRGYVADMLYELGHRPPTMDLPVFLRDEPPDL